MYDDGIGDASFMRLSQGIDPYRLRGNSVPASFPIPFCLAFCRPHQWVPHKHPPKVCGVSPLPLLPFCGDCIICFATECQSPALDAWLTGTSISFLHNWTACIWVHTQGFFPLSAISLGLNFRSNITDQECNHFMNLIMFYYFPWKKFPVFYQ